MGLTDSELDELDKTNAATIAELQGQGVTIAGVSEYFVRRMLEEMAGPVIARRIREETALWCADNLELMQEQIRQMKAAALLGVPQANGHAGNRAARRHG